MKNTKQLDTYKVFKYRTQALCTLFRFHLILTDLVIVVDQGDQHIIINPLRKRNGLASGLQFECTNILLTNSQEHAYLPCDYLTEYIQVTAHVQSEISVEIRKPKDRSLRCFEEVPSSGFRVIMGRTLLDPRGSSRLSHVGIPPPLILPNHQNTTHPISPSFSTPQRTSAGCLHFNPAQTLSFMMPRFFSRFRIFWSKNSKINEIFCVKQTSQCRISL